MSGQKLLDGEVLSAAPDARDVQIATLERELQQAQHSLRRALADAEEAHEEAQRATAALRRNLTPLYRALQMVFGELDAIGGSEDVSASTAAAPANSKTTAVWDAWKQKVSPACGKVIDALLSHGELNSVQIKVAARLGTSTVSDSVSKLNKLGLINKNGGRFSLKQL